MKGVVYMLTIKDKLKLWKFNRLVDKRNKAFFKGEYSKAIEYGKMVDHYITDILRL